MCFFHFSCLISKVVCKNQAKSRPEFCNYFLFDMSKVQPLNDLRHPHFEDNDFSFYVYYCVEYHIFVQRY